MDTLSHGAWTYLLMHRHPKRWFTVIGMMFPDIILIGMAILLILQGRFDLFAPKLPQLFAVPGINTLNSAFHSLIPWAVVLFVALVFHIPNLQWFVYGVYLHILVDILTHHSFIPEYLWPLSHITIPGPLDYTKWGFMIVDILLLIGFFAWYRYHGRLKI